MSVAKQFNNRRENILINDIPPEILTEAKLTADGYVKNTDYATATKAGVFKTSSNYRTYVNTSNGLLTCSEITAAQYPTASNDAFISKKTLENIFGDKWFDAWKTLMLSTAGVTNPDALPVGTTIGNLTLVKVEDGFDVTVTKTEPETP